VTGLWSDSVEVNSPIYEGVVVLPPKMLHVFMGNVSLSANQKEVILNFTGFKFKIMEKPLKP
jgi:hypothetical protein